MGRILIAFFLCLSSTVMLGQTQLIGEDINRLTDLGSSPLDIDSVYVWYSMRNGSVLDSAGTSPQDWEGIGFWDDLSSNARDLTSGGNKPRYREGAGPNGYPAMYFRAATSDLMSHNGTWWSGNDFTMVLVMKFENATYDQFEDVAAMRDGQTTWFFDGRPASLSYVLDMTVSSDGTAGTYKNFRWASKFDTYLILIYTHNGTSSAFAYHNGVSQSISTSGAGSGNLFNQTLDVDIGGFGLNAYIMEYLVYSRVVGASERDFLNNYFNEIYNIY